MMVHFHGQFYLFIKFNKILLATNNIAFKVQSNLFKKYPRNKKQDHIFMTEPISFNDIKDSEI